MSQNNELNLQNPANSKKLDRIDKKYIWKEISSVINFDKGIFYTIKELSIRPGKSVRDYLFTDRSKLVKPILFLIITSFIYSIINSVFKIEESYIQHSGLEGTTISKMFYWMQANYGYANILMGFFIAGLIKLFFRKLDFNFYEIIILLSYIMGMGMLIFSIFSLIEGIFHVKIFQFAGILSFVYLPYAIADFYDRTKFINYLKALVAYLLGMLAFIIVIIGIGIGVDLFLKI